MKKLLTILVTAIMLAGTAFAMSAAAPKKKGAKKSATTTTSVVKEYNPETGISYDKFPIFVELYKPGYAPSTRFKKTFASAASQLKGKAAFYRMNIDKYPDLAIEMNVYELPYVVIITGPNAFASVSGEFPLSALKQVMMQVINDTNQSYYW